MKLRAQILPEFRNYKLAWEGLVEAELIDCSYEDWVGIFNPSNTFIPNKIDWKKSRNDFSIFFFYAYPELSRGTPWTALCSLITIQGERVNPKIIKSKHNKKGILSQPNWVNNILK